MVEAGTECAADESRVSAVSVVKVVNVRKTGWAIGYEEERGKCFAGIGYDGLCSRDLVGSG